MRRNLLMAGSFLLLAACSTPQTSGPQTAGNSLDARMTGTFDYLCGSQPIQIRFDNDRKVAVLMMNGQQTELTRKATRTGFIYQDATTQISGNDQRLQIHGPMGQLDCVMK